MMTFKQLSIDDICRNRHKGNKYSETANTSLRGGAKAKICAAIVQHVASRGAIGATAEEIMNSLSMRYATVSARCSELKASGVLVEQGSRKTTSGRPAAVLIVIGASAK